VATTAASVEIRDVGVTFPSGPDGRPLEAIRKVDQKIAPGSFVSIVGPSGCGKSTLLSLIAGMGKPTSGDVAIGDRIVSAPDRSVGFVFQEESTLPWKTVEENVAFGLKLAGASRDEQHRVANDMLRLVGLVGFNDAYPSELSGGMRQRVAIARTLALDPTVLLMDEPFGALDQQTRLLIGAEVRRIWRETNKTIAFVTHDIQEAIMLSEQVWVMSFRPAEIVDVIDIDLPADRDPSIIATDRFNELFARIWATVQGEAMQAFHVLEEGRADGQ
jgi:NitT/TauT family transport system ATP-binding protein